MADMETVHNSCRLCLIPSVNKPITDSTGSAFPIVSSIDISPLKDQLSRVFNFTFDQLSQLPKHVCDQCCTIVCDFHRFSEMVQKNQIYLRTLAGTTVTAPEVKEDPVEEMAADCKTDLIPPDMVKVEPEPHVEVMIAAETEWIVGGKSLDGDDIEEDDCDGNNGSGDDSDEDDDWKPREEAEEKDNKKQTMKVKRKYTRKTPKKPKKIKKESGHDPSKEYRSKPKDEIEEEDRQILEYFKFACELCHETTLTFIDLRRHFREKHNQKGYHRCCNKKLFKRCHLLEHIQVHLNPNLYGCDLCPKSFRSKEYLQLHKMQSHAAEVDRPYKCDKCPKSFIQKGQLSSHMGRHLMYPCTLCDKVLAGKGSLTAHMVNMHSDMGRMICDTCGREFKTKPCFDKHVRKHMGMLEDTSIECHVCGVVLHNKATMKKHMIAKHTQTDEVFICNECGKQAPNKFALESHKRKVHCEEKYQCEFCEKRFKNPITLKEHRATHTGEILYQCPFCATTFNSKANMYAHKKKAHPYEWAQERISKGQAQRHAQLQS
ncbi:transcription factor grauzone-like isoform X1 [Sabethes cyaneus]|uniref:transcription factor grauzone-like isoform X1 n=1 Tax=Sabethes cyaneus TaxID=53552 RepID=UPI00237E9FB7|nr:transcription factor grauzone-like isoform X1 [Sabethes cyaneus]XP_053685525.1 transcription factor grauzone-like isoform X1 [Sabethes cyaneus]XP_053685526.1 transcription factor grauzone-like isoform X1 [Sabethes cyaneus]XP_053685527.1 transcription factor grauzone-like isoform X1 [Sabethes cyaneus]